MTRRGFGLALAFWLWLGLPSGASAFSDPLSFGLPAAQAGGGGRYFTGSPADGYTCKVCHQGGMATSMQVDGLPLDGYALGHSYEIVVDWPDSIDKFSIAAELTDRLGNAAGNVRLPPSNELQVPEYCEPASDQIPAAVLNDAGNARQVISVPDCGAKQLRFLWTAPTSDIGPVWFASSSVVSDGQGDPNGDGVTDVSRVFGSISGPPVIASSVTAGCSVRLDPSHSRSSGFELLVGIGLALLHRARTRGR